MSDDPFYWDYPDFTKYTFEELITEKHVSLTRQKQYHKSYKNMTLSNERRELMWKHYCYHIYREDYVQKEINKRLSS